MVSVFHIFVNSKNLEISEHLKFVLLQVILPLGDEEDRRAGKDPKGDSKRYPPGGKCIQGVTGELVCIRKAPDLEAVRR